MRTSKKLLSLFLAIVMVVTSCSVGFTAFGAENTDANNSYWNDKADAEAAFQSINELINFFIPTVLAIEVDEETHATLGQSLGISADKYDEATLQQIVAALSPKLVAPLGNLKKTLTGGSSASKEDIIKNYLGVDQYDKIYDVYFTYLDDPDAKNEDYSGMSFFDLYQFCSDNTSSSDPSLKAYATTTKEALEILLAAYKSVSDKMGAATKIYSNIPKRCAQPTAEATAESVFNGTALKDLKSTSGSYDAYAVGVEVAHNYYKSLGMDSIADKITNPGAAFYYYYSTQGSVLKKALVGLKLAVDAGETVTTQPIKNYYTGDSFEAKSITTANYESVLADFFEKYKTESGQYSTPGRTVTEDEYFFELVEYTKVVKDKTYAKLTAREKTALKKELNKFKTNGTWKNSKTGTEYTYDEAEFNAGFAAYAANFAAEVPGAGIYGDMITQCIQDLNTEYTPSNNISNEYYSSSFVATTNKIAADYINAGLIEGVKSLDDVKITKAQMQKAAEMAIEKKCQYGKDFYDKVVDTDNSPFSAPVKYLFNYFLTAASLTTAEPMIDKFVQTLTDNIINVDASISTPVKDELGADASDAAIAEKTAEKAMAFKFGDLLSDTQKAKVETEFADFFIHQDSDQGSDRTIIGYYNNHVGSFLLRTQFSQYKGASGAATLNTDPTTLVNAITLYTSYIKPAIQKAEKSQYKYSDYQIPDKAAVAAVNYNLNKIVQGVLSPDTKIGGMVVPLINSFTVTEIDADSLLALLDNLWSNLADNPIDTIVNLVPVLVILIDEVVEPLIFNGTGDAYNATNGLYGPLSAIMPAIQGVSLEGGNTEIGITTLAFDLNKLLPALLNGLLGNTAEAKAIVGTYADLVSDESYPIPADLDINYDTIKYTGIYVADKALNGAKISDIAGLITTEDERIGKGVAEAVKELATFMLESVNDYVAAHGTDARYIKDGRVGNRGLNNIFVALPQLLDILGKKFIQKYDIDSDWSYCYDGKIYEDTVKGEVAGSSELQDVPQLKNKSLEDFKLLFKENDPKLVLGKFVEILVGDQINALIDILNDVFSSDSNKITSNIVLVQQLLDALGGLGEKSIITDVLDGLFQLKRFKNNGDVNEKSFSLVERDTTKFVGFSNEACLFLLSNIIYTAADGQKKGLVPLIGTLINGKAPEGSATTNAKLGSKLGAGLNSPLLAASKKTNYKELLSKKNQKNAERILKKVDDILATILDNASLNGFTLNSNDGILSGVVSTVSNYIGDDNTNKLIALLDDYLKCIVGTNSSSKTGKVNAKAVYTSANLSNLVIETYTLIENVVDYVFYDSGLIADMKYKDPNGLLADAIYGIVSPDAVAIRMSDEYSSVANKLKKEENLNWNDLKGNNVDLGYGFRKGNKEAFYDALGESFNGIAAIIGVVLTASYTDSAKSGNYYSKVIYPVINSLAKATGATGVMSPTAFNNASNSQKLIRGLLTPVSNIISQIYDAPASFVLNVVRGLAGVLDDASLKSIVGGLTAPVNNLLGGVGNLVSYLSPSLAAVIGDIGELKIELPYSKDILVSAINKLLGGAFTLPPIDWKRLAKTTTPAQAMLLIYGYAVDTILGSDLLTGLVENASPEIAKMIKNLSSTEILNLINDILAVFLSSTEVYWTFSSYKTDMFSKNFKYPTDITASQADDAVGQLDELVNNIFPLLKSLGVADIEGLSALVNDNLYTNDILTTLAKTVYGALESNETIATVLTSVGLDLSPAGFAKILTDKSYGKTYTSAANTLAKAKSWSKVKTLNWGFTNGSSKAQTGFINGLAAILRPINGVLAIFLAEGGSFVNEITPAQKAELVDMIKGINLDETKTPIAEDSDFGCVLKITIKKGILKLVIDSNNSKDDSTVKVDLAAIVSDVIDSLLDGKVSGNIGTNGYESAIVPILEAFMCKNVKTYAQYISDYNKAKDNLIINILTPLFGFVNDVVDAPFDTITKVLPNVAYFIDSNGLMQAISNLLAIVTAKDGILGVLDKHGINVDKLIKAIAGKSLGDIVTDALGIDAKLNIQLTNLSTCNIQVIILPLVRTLLKNAGIDITIPDFDLATIASHGTLETVKSAAKNDKGKYTTKRVVAKQGEVLVAVLRYVADVLIKNATFLKNTLCGIDAIKKNATIKNVLTSVFNQIKTASKDDIVRAVFYFLNQEAANIYYSYTDYKSKSYSFSYNDIDAAFCAQFAGQLDGDIEKIFGLLKSLGVADIESLQSLVDDNLYKDSIISALATGLYGAIDGVKVGSSTLSALLAQTDIDCTTTGFAALLTNKAYGKQYKAAAKVIGAAKNWKNVDASKLKWGVKDKATFLNALVAVLRPLYGVLDTLLTNGSLGIFNLVTLPGSNGYESSIAPLLEALSVTGLKTDAQLKADAAKAYDNLLLDIITPLVNKVEEIIGKPIETLADMLPTFALFMANDGHIQCINNLLAPISELLDAIKPIVDVNDVLDALGLDVNALLKKAGLNVKIKIDVYNLPKTLKPVLGSTSLVPFLNNVLGLIKVGGKPLAIKLPEIDWYKLASHGTTKTVKSVAMNTQGKYTRQIVEGRQGETLLAVLRYIESVIIKNAKALQNLLCSIDAIKKNATIVKILKSVFTNISKAKMDEIIKALFYFFMGRQTDSFFDYSNFIYKTDYEFSYGDMDVDFCKQLAPMLDGLIGGLLADKGGLLGLITDMIYKDEIIGKLATGLYGAIEGVKIDGIGSLNNILKLIGIDFSTSNVADLLEDESYGRTYPDVARKIRSAGSWKNVKAESLSWGVKDRDSFLNALVSVLRPIYGVLDVLLNDGNLSLYDIVYVPGSDGYTSTIVPLLEAFGVYNIKTQYQYREDMANAYDAILLDIINPLFDKVEDILNAPIEMLADILPNLSLFFANDGLLQIIENLLTPVSALLEAVRPIVDVNDLLGALGVNLNSLLGKVGLKVNVNLDVYDLTSTLKPLIGAENVVTLLNGVLSIIKIKGAALGIELPEIDWFRLASHGEVITNEASQAATIGGRIHVVADQDETLIAVLRYLIDTINYKGNYDAIVGLIGGLLGDGVSDTVSGVIDQVLGMLKGDSDEVIQSLVELLQQLAG